ncbi:MAG: hypothetical protein SFZ03_11785 [Candidatus Melainabacteria bacterium]|nr:hypothetical protein [Candidatus Melainabacteria bacterium]
MKIILIHGIGNYNPGWSAALQADQILGVTPDRILEFNYEDLMENNWVNKLLVMGARVAASYYAGPAAGIAANVVQDYIDDILTFFAVPGIRKKIMSRLLVFLEKFPDAIIIAYSLGSIVAYETVKNYPESAKGHILITVGSPLGSPALNVMVKRFIKVPDHLRPNVTGWFNFYSKEDFISGYINGLGCRQPDQFRINSTHSLTTYLQHIRNTFAQKFT